MRSPQKSNRARNRGSRKPTGNVLNRVYDSSGPEGKVRGTPQQIIDKYLSLARDAQTSGDRVNAENFLQHAEHYQRLVIQATQQQADRRDGQGADQDDDGYDGDHPPRRESREPAIQPSNAASGAPAETSASGDQGTQPHRNGADTVETDPREALQEHRDDTDRDGAGVGGLTTFDNDGDGASPLLLAEDEVSHSQPKPRRRRSRKSENGAASPSEPADPQPDPPSN